MGRIAAIDLGSVRIGIAISDPLEKIAFTVGMVRALKTGAATCLAIVDSLKSYFPLDKIVIGLPLLMSGKEGDGAIFTRKFAALLQEHFSCPIVLWDERLTSKQVEKSLIECGVNRKKRTTIVDALAAQAILQNYLDRSHVDSQHSL